MVVKKFNYGDDDENEPTGLCLVTGEHKPIAVLNNAISLRNANASGAKLVGFQKGSGYDSIRKNKDLMLPYRKKRTMLIQLH